MLDDFEDGRRQLCGGQSGEVLIRVYRGWLWRAVRIKLQQKNQ